MTETARTETRAQGDARRHLTVCIVTETFPPEVNGVAMSLSRFATGLRSLGHDVQLVLPHRDDRQERHLHGSVAALPVRGLPLPRYPDLRFGLPAGRAIRQMWKSNPPDIVYVATQGPLGWSAVRAARQLSIPVLSGFHTNFHVYCRHYGLKALETLAIAWLRRFHRQTDCTLAPTGDMQNMLTAMGLDPVRVLGRGVDNGLFTPERRDHALRESWGLGPDDLAVIYVGRLAAEKNLPLAVNAFRALEEACGNARFILVGDGPLGEELRRDNPDFIFCGMRTGEDLARHYASGDLFLFPSVTETFGNVLLEAMASGLAVVAYDCAAAREHIRSYRNGVTVETSCESAFLHAAITLAADPALVRTTRENARRHALGHGWNDVALTLERLLIEHLPAAGAARGHE
jgi:glycosyltransferase involved in cell wall biosynthesis